MNRGNTSIAKQIWYRYGSINTNDYQIYVRTLGDTSGWSSWRRLMCEDDLYYKSGDSVTLNNIVSAGFVTTSATEIYFSVYLPKNATNVTPNFKSGTWSVRHVGGGYLFSNTNIANTGSITLYRKENMLRFAIKSSTAFNITNNSPLSIHIQNVVIDFR